MGFLDRLYGSDGSCWSELDALRLCRYRLADLLRHVYFAPLFRPQRASLSEAIDSCGFGLEAPENFGRLLARTLPEAHAELGWNGTAPPSHLTRGEALRVLVAGYRALRPRIPELRTANVPDWVRRDGPEWLQTSRGNPGHWAVERLIQQIEPHLNQSFSSLVIHGSVGTNEVIPGMSDLDTMVLLSNDAFANEAELDQALRILSGTHASLLAFHPYMHHSHMLAAEMDLCAMSIAITPPCLFRMGVSWGAWNASAGVAASDLDCLLMFRIFEWFFEEWVPGRSALHDAYDVIWWASNLTILPVLYAQMRDGVDRWKPDAIAQARPDLSGEEVDLLDFVTNLRDQCREIPVLPEDWWKGFPTDAHPALATQHARAMTSDIDWSARGIAPERLRKSTAFYRNIRQRAYRLWRQRNAAHAPMAMSSWFTLPVPVSFAEEPRPAPMAEYDVVRQEFLDKATSIPGVVAVFQFGEVGCPGLSDLDFLVVVDKHCDHAEELLGGLVSGPSAEIMGHGPMVLSAEAFQMFPSVFPVFRLERLYGDIDLPALTPMQDDVLVPMIACMLLSKYVADLIYLRTQAQVRLKTLAAFAHSYVHFVRMLTAIHAEVPASVRRMVEFDSRTRGIWASTGKFDWREMIGGLDLMLDASADLVAWLNGYLGGEQQPQTSAPSISWFPESGPPIQFLPEWSRDLLRESVEEACQPGASTALAFPEAVGNYLAWMSEHAGPAGSTLMRQLRPQREPRADSTFDRFTRYRENLNQFVGIESGRRVSKYISLTDIAPIGSTVPAHPAPRLALARREELASHAYKTFMDQVNSFAAYHGMHVFRDWSKVWEYPWLWWNGLRERSWAGAQVVDIGSELSPMPWFLASNGARVLLTEVNAQWVPQWMQWRRKLAVDVDWHILDSEKLPVPDAWADVVTSFSVIEHQKRKAGAVDEIVRVLKPGGMLAVSFDICEPEMGMTFPDWNGVALTMRDFEKLIWYHPAFGQRNPPQWNCADIPAFLEWHRRGAPHHNYAVGAAVLRKLPADLRTTHLRVRHLAAIRDALAAHHRELGAYPKSSGGFDGLSTKWGLSAPNWIPGLVPAYLPELPRDPRQNDDPVGQYLYRSDGADYKVISHFPDDLPMVRQSQPDLVDPVRPGWAYGYWTANAAGW